jgi:outer membrane receptor protein involved in Fe transport
LIPRRAATAALSIVAIVASARPAAAQAWAPRAREGDVTVVVQTIDHLGRVFKDVKFDCCETTNVGFVVDANYGLTNRWSVSAGLPYVFAKYWGQDHPESPPPPPWLTLAPVDECRCLHSSFQDVSFGAHYNLVKVRRSFSLMTSVTTGVPSHAYQYVGEAVVGFDLKELSLSADAGQRLDFILPGLSIDGRYAYTLVEQVLDFSHNRSNIGLDVGYTLPNHFAGHLILSWQQTYGGVTVLPDEIAGNPALYTEFHRLLRDNYFHAGAGASYTWREWELSFSFQKTISGDNTHIVHVYTLETSRSFRVRH